MKLLGKELAKDIKELILSGTPSVGGAVSPVVGVALTVAGECAKKADAIRLMYLIDLLGKGLDEESLKNKLVTYIKEKSERAMLVVDTFRKVLLQESIISNTLMVILLAKNINSDSDYSQEDLIIYKALQNANDYDLSIFRGLSKSKKLKNDDQLSKEEQLTCRWCVQNRLFDEHIMEWNIIEQYTSTNVSDKLLHLMDEVPSYLWKD